jgi:hypothetical protein
MYTYTRVYTDKPPQKHAHTHTIKKKERGERERMEEEKRHEWE